MFGGYLPFGHRDRHWDFRSIGGGRIDFEDVNRAGYQGPLSVEWEDIGMEREFGAREACAKIKSLDFAASTVAFDAAFAAE